VVTTTTSSWPEAKQATVQASLDIMKSSLMLARSPPSSKSPPPSKAASPSLPRAVLLSPGETPPPKITAAAKNDVDDTDENVAADHFDDGDDSPVDKRTLLKTTTVHIKEGDGNGDTVTKRIELIPMALLAKADNNTTGGHQAMNGSGGDAAVSGDSGDTSGGLVRNGGEVVAGGGANNRRPPPDERTPLIQQDIRGR